jgi:hypothetical protein
MPPASDVNTMRSPSGVQDGCDPKSTICRGAPPPDGIIQMPPFFR